MSININSLQQMGFDFSGTNLNQNITNTVETTEVPVGGQQVGSVGDAAELSSSKANFSSALRDGKHVWVTRTDGSKEKYTFKSNKEAKKFEAQCNKKFNVPETWNKKPITPAEVKPSPQTPVVEPEKAPSRREELHKKYDGTEVEQRYRQQLHEETAKAEKYRELAKQEKIELDKKAKELNKTARDLINSKTPEEFAKNEKELAKNRSLFQKAKATYRATVAKFKSCATSLKNLWTRLKTATSAKFGAAKAAKGAEEAGKVAGKGAEAAKGAEKAASKGAGKSKNVSKGLGKLANVGRELKTTWKVLHPLGKGAAIVFAATMIGFGIKALFFDEDNKPETTQVDESNEVPVTETPEATDTTLGAAEEVATETTPAPTEPAAAAPEQAQVPAASETPAGSAATTPAKTPGQAEAADSATVQNVIDEAEQINPEGDIEAAENEANAISEYEVKDGDNLWKVAKQMLESEGKEATNAAIVEKIGKLMEANGLSWYKEEKYGKTMVMIHTGDKIKNDTEVDAEEKKQEEEEK